MKTVKTLEGQNKSLCELLVRKDREISEYVMEKGDISKSKTTYLRFLTFLIWKNYLTI